jgi:protein-S-isoprenylcysteine O-methyltransferase Ste14
MDPILFEIVLWVGGLAAVGSAVGVCLVLAAWWLFARLSARIDRNDGGSP